MKPDYQKIFEALGVTPIVERIICNRHLVPSKTEIYPNFKTLIYQDVILLQTPRQVIERDPAMCRILSMIAARFSYGNRLFYLDEDLAKALLRTDPPPDLQFHDLKVAIPSFLVVLPRSLIRSGADHVQALEIALLEPGTWKVSLGSMIDDLPFHISHPVFGIALHVARAADPLLPYVVDSACDVTDASIRGLVETLVPTSTDPDTPGHLNASEQDALISGTRLA